MVTPNSEAIEMTAELTLLIENSENEVSILLEDEIQVQNRKCQQSESDTVGRSVSTNRKRNVSSMSNSIKEMNTETLNVLRNIDTNLSNIKSILTNINETLQEIKNVILKK